jgi:hypothetical protein
MALANQSLIAKIRRKHHKYQTYASENATAIVVATDKHTVASIEATTKAFVRQNRRALLINLSRSHYFSRFYQLIKNRDFLLAFPTALISLLTNLENLGTLFSGFPLTVGLEHTAQNSQIGSQPITLEPNREIERNAQDEATCEKNFQENLQECLEENFEENFEQFMPMWQKKLAFLPFFVPAVAPAIVLLISKSFARNLELNEALNSIEKQIDDEPRTFIILVPKAEFQPFKAQLRRIGLIQKDAQHEDLQEKPERPACRVFFQAQKERLSSAF